MPGFINQLGIIGVIGVVVAITILLSIKRYILMINLLILILKKGLID